jgi:cytochrome P450
LGDPHGGDFIECPYPRYVDAQRAGRAAFRIEGLGVGVVGYENLVRIATDNEHFSRSIPAQMARLGLGESPPSPEVVALQRELIPAVPALFTADPPLHTRHRRLVNQAFAPRRIRELEPKLVDLAHELIDGFAPDGRAEFVSAFAIPFPLGMITDMLGVPRADTATMKRWTDDMLAGVADVLSDERRLAVTRSALDFQRYFLELIAVRRRAPAADVLSDLIAARLPDGSSLSDAELLTIIGQIAVAGHETSTNFLGNALVMLLRDEALTERLRADRSLIPSFVEEALRADPPLHCSYRRSTVRQDLDGVPIEPDQHVALFWAAAGYDEAVFDDPLAVRLDREGARRHLAFGYGTHFCVGNELARQEARIALGALLDRLPDLRLDEERSDLRHRDSFAHHGYRSIAIAFERERR